MAKREKPYKFVSAVIPLLPKENQQVSMPSKEIQEFTREESRK